MDKLYKRLAKEMTSVAIEADADGLELSEIIRKVYDEVIKEHIVDISKDRELFFSYTFDEPDPSIDCSDTVMTALRLLDDVIAIACSAYAEGCIAVGR